MNTRTALLAGATGLVGGHLLDRLLADPRYTRVTALTRRPLARAHDKLDVRVVDFTALAQHDVPTVDDVYCTLGTTIKKAGSQESFRAVDQHHTLAVARHALAAGASGIALCSSIGADPDARTFYLRVKGDTEREVIALGYRRTQIFRPSLLLGDRAERRPGERAMTTLAPVLAPVLVGPLRPYRPITADRLAAAMLTSLTTAEPGSDVYAYDAITELANR
ncbi:NAD(P)H-binding protein [Streptomyces sp. NRRL B-1347]|uniref:NAD(P)H-binding protein n=1 Tax=Streptomyces sp. NRRL B-1347 TaxID=1476877 RepID=UPI0005644BEC|nr:NAD(P)H-binding protein [Streptomyces sp. NRRL B-1347]